MTVRYLQLTLHRISGVPDLRPREANTRWSSPWFPFRWRERRGEFTRQDTTEHTGHRLMWFAVARGCVATSQELGTLRLVSESLLPARPCSPSRQLGIARRWTSNRTRSVPEDVHRKWCTPRAASKAKERRLLPSGPESACDANSELARREQPPGLLPCPASRRSWESGARNCASAMPAAIQRRRPIAARAGRPEVHATTAAT